MAIFLCKYKGLFMCSWQNIKDPYSIEYCKIYKKNLSIYYIKFYIYTYVYIRYIQEKICNLQIAHINNSEMKRERII